MTYLTLKITSPLSITLLFFELRSSSQIIRSFIWRLSIERHSNIIESPKSSTKILFIFIRLFYWFLGLNLTNIRCFLVNLPPFLSSEKILNDPRWEMWMKRLKEIVVAWHWSKILSFQCFCRHWISETGKLPQKYFLFPLIFQG